MIQAVRQVYCLAACLLYWLGIPLREMKSFFCFTTDFVWYKQSEGFQGVVC